jgi:hypothetical protein
MPAGDAAGYRREALIGLAKTFEAVCGDHDLVNLAHPLAHEPGSGLEPWPGVVLPCRAQRGRLSRAVSPCFRDSSPYGLVPESERQGWAASVPGEDQAMLGVKTLVPEVRQRGMVERRQLFK